MPDKQLFQHIHIRLGEPEHVDFKKNLFIAFTLFTSGVSMDSNPQPVDSQSATFTVQPHRFTLSFIHY